MMSLLHEHELRHNLSSGAAVTRILSVLSTLSLCSVLRQRKQQELGDMMDLSSYLLRPIQRISKYSLLLQDVLALSASRRPRELVQEALLASSVCAQSTYEPDLTSGERERERAEIQAAAELVRFQMRHGNDLLTMDAIRDCDVRRRTFLLLCVCSGGVKAPDGTFTLPGEPEGAGPADSPGRVYRFLPEEEMRAARLPLRGAHPLQQDQEERRGQRRLRLQAVLQGWVEVFASASDVLSGFPSS